jgi:hypothetical protein
MAKEMMNSAFETSLFTLRKDFLHDKILQHGAGGFTSPPKEGALRIVFISL